MNLYSQKLLLIPTDEGEYVTTELTLAVGNRGFTFGMATYNFVAGKEYIIKGISNKNCSSTQEIGIGNDTFLLSVGQTVKYIPTANSEYILIFFGALNVSFTLSVSERI